jgi:hypothetical protein
MAEATADLVKHALIKRFNGLFGMATRTRTPK